MSVKHKLRGMTGNRDRDLQILWKAVTELQELQEQGKVISVNRRPAEDSAAETEGSESSG